VLNDIQEAKDLLVGVPELNAIKLSVLDTGQLQVAEYSLMFDPNRDNDIQKFWIKTSIDGQIKSLDTSFFTEWHLKHQDNVRQDLSHSLWQGNIIYNSELVKCKINIEESTVKMESRIFSSSKFSVISNNIKIYFDFNINHISELFYGCRDIYLLV
jgi:hypothetical protein